MSYMPLEFCKNVLKDGEPFASIQEMFKNAKVPNYQDINEDEFIRYALSNTFCSKDCPEKFQAFDKNLYTNQTFLNFIIQNAGATLKDFENGSYSIATEWRDYLLGPCLWNRWAKNKQVYKPDRDFAEALIGTEKLSLTKNQIEHLPCNSIYIDMEDISVDPAVGAFVFIESDGHTVYLAVYLLTSDMLFFSFYAGGNYDENGVLQIDLNEMEKSKGFEVFQKHAEIAGLEGEMAGKRSLELIGEHDRLWTTRFALQLLCYISSKEPDIEENPQTKLTYKPSTKVRNKYSEIQKWDVGIRYGKSVRTKVEEEAKKYFSEEAANNEVNTVPGEKNTEKKRKSPSPHFRSAHWQRFWVGEGRKVCEVRWIEPVFVGFSKAKDVVIHKIQ